MPIEHAPRIAAVPSNATSAFQLNAFMFSSFQSKWTWPTQGKTTIPGSARSSSYQVPVPWIPAYAPVPREMSQVPENSPVVPFPRPWKLMSNDPTGLVRVVLIIPAQFGFPLPPWNVRSPFCHVPDDAIGRVAVD